MVVLFFFIVFFSTSYFLDYIEYGTQKLASDLFGGFSNSKNQNMNI